MLLVQQGILLVELLLGMVGSYSWWDNSGLLLVEQHWNDVTAGGTAVGCCWWNSTGMKFLLVEQQWVAVGGAALE